MSIKIHPDVFKFNLPIVEKLQTGKISLQQFAATLTQEDPFILIGDTVYALTEKEFYSLKQRNKALTKEEFTKLLFSDIWNDIPEDQLSVIDEARRKIKGCSLCTYNRYKTRVLNIAKANGLDILPKDPSVVYVAPSESIATTVSGIMDLKDAREPDHITNPDITRASHTRIESAGHTRQPCIDCTEKHIAQAYVLASESILGYPEHLPLVIAHLAEAFVEVPDMFKNLKWTIKFCMDKTIKDRQAFIPLSSFSVLIDMAREQLKNDMPEDTSMFTKTPDKDTNIDLTDAIKEELSRLDVSDITKLITGFNNAVGLANEYKINKTRQTLMKWEGTLAYCAEAVAAIAPATAGMIRNIRLIFVSSPDVMLEAGYDFKEILSYMRSLKKDTSAG